MAMPAKIAIALKATAAGPPSGGILESATVAVEIGVAATCAYLLGFLLLSIIG
jgi:hypothetical protein